METALTSLAAHQTADSGLDSPYQNGGRGCW